MCVPCKVEGRWVAVDRWAQGGGGGDVSRKAVTESSHDPVLLSAE